MPLIDVESDPVEVDGEEKAIKFSDGFLDLDFTKGPNDLQMEIPQKDSGVVSQSNLEYEGFEEETEIVGQEDEGFADFSTAPTAKTAQIDPESVLMENAQLEDLNANFNADFADYSNVETTATNPEDFEDQLNESAHNHKDQATEESISDIKNAAEATVEDFADFSVFSAASPARNASLGDRSELPGGLNEGGSVSQNAIAETAASQPELQTTENFARFPSIEDSQITSSPQNSPKRKLEPSPSLKILNDLDKELDTLNSDSPIASTTREPFPRQSMNLNLHENEEQEISPQETSSKSQLIVEHESWLSWRSIFCLK